jgi:ubiquinone/menaquinone biosynthesis C-methylase UbiE
MGEGRTRLTQNIYDKQKSFEKYQRLPRSLHGLGIDVSRKMLTRARAETHDPGISYLGADLDRLRLQSSSFDLVFSSLALHYVKNLGGLMSKVRRSLVSGGSLVFSVEHPIYTVSSTPRWRTASGCKFWPVDGYLEEGPRSTDWLARGVIKQHRTLATYINMFVRLGFSISKVNEWGPTRRQIASQPGWADERKRRAFLLVAARR